MDFRRFKLKLLVLPAVAVLLAAASSEAQPQVTNDWQSIVFSSPSNSEASSNLTSSLPAQPSASSDLQSQLQMYQDSSPVAFHSSPVPGPAPMPRPAIRVHKPSNSNREWEFMTPAQILGVSPDQILQAQGGNANSDQSGLTRLERILLGRNPARNLKAVAAGNVTASASQNFWSDINNNSKKGIMADLVNSTLGNLQSDVYGPSANDAGNDNPFADPGDKSAWSKLFGLPSPPPVPDSVQELRHQEEMKQFMQLLNPGSAAAATTTASSDETAPAETATPFSSFDSTTPLANPLGNPFASPFASLTENTSLTRGIGKPTSFAPLPAITQQANNQPAVKPAWAPQPPPWLSPTPQPFAIPHSKF